MSWTHLRALGLAMPRHHHAIARRRETARTTVSLPRQSRSQRQRKERWKVRREIPLTRGSQVLEKEIGFLDRGESGRVVLLQKYC